MPRSIPSSAATVDRGPPVEALAGLVERVTFHNEIGPIEIGKKADLTFVRLDVPAMRPLINPVSNLVHYGHPGIVHSVMVDGVFLMRDGVLTTIDEPDLLQRAEDATARVWARLLAANPDLQSPKRSEP